MANTWGAQTWGAGTWSDQDSNAAALSGISLSSTIGTLEFAGSVNGWGRGEWGSGAWGITGSAGTFTIQFPAFTTSAAILRIA